MSKRPRSRGSPSLATQRRTASTSAPTDAARARKLRRCASARAPARRHRTAEPIARAGGPRGGAGQDHAERDAVARRGKPPPAPLSDRGRAGRGAAPGRHHQRRTSAPDRLRRSRRQRLARGQPVHRHREQGEPPPGRRDLRQRPAAWRDRTQEPRRRERDARRRVQPACRPTRRRSPRCSAPTPRW